ncbi:unnamed protein product [Moneuplotes crassus]|uniref:Uncharacterized protein n=1 Tax=Euplotes crassus TaxID=5936 RepID=A0AAD1XIF4_EUPCR|nr:unnamed protein product [Moneuplotes crassus]
MGEICSGVILYHQYGSFYRIEEILKLLKRCILKLKTHQIKVIQICTLLYLRVCSSIIVLPDYEGLIENRLLPLKRMKDYSKTNQETHRCFLSHNKNIRISRHFLCESLKLGFIKKCRNYLKVWSCSIQVLEKYLGSLRCYFATKGNLLIKRKVEQQMEQKTEKRSQLMFLMDNCCFSSRLDSIVKL